MEKIARHGDMMLYKVSSEMVKNLKQKVTQQVTVGLGEVTGHSHVVLPVGDCEIVQYYDEDVDAETAATMDRLFFEIKNEIGLIVHEEHDPIVLEQGIYLRINQMEYNPFEGIMRRIAD